MDLLRSRKVTYPWIGETHFKAAPDVYGKSVLRTSARILVLVNHMNPMAIADSRASHVVLHQTALYDDKSAKLVNLRLAAGEINAVEAHREIFAQHVTILAHQNRSDVCDLRLRCPSRPPESRDFREAKAMLHCDLRVRWKVASDLRFRAAISEPKTPSFCGI